MQSATLAQAPAPVPVVETPPLPTPVVESDVPSATDEPSAADEFDSLLNDLKALKLSVI